MATVRYTPTALAALPHTPDGEQLLIYPWQAPDDRKAILDEMAAEGAHAPKVQWIVRGVIAGLAQHLRRMPTPQEIAQSLLDALYELVEYRNDPASDQDFYQPVLITLRPVPGNPISPITGQPKGIGDCEDTSVLYAAFANAVPLVSGIPMSGRVEWLSQPDSPQNHVAASVTLPSGRAWAETTIAGARIGEHPYAVLARLGNQHAAHITG